MFSFSFFHNVISDKKNIPELSWSCVVKCESDKQPRVYRVEQRDAEVLDDAVESHELEHAE